MSARRASRSLVWAIAAMAATIPETRAVGRHRTTINRPSTRTPYSPRRSWRGRTSGMLPRGGQK